MRSQYFNLKTSLRFSRSPFNPMTSSALFWVLCIMLSTAFNRVFNWSNCDVDFIMTWTKFDILSKIWFFSFSSFCVSSSCWTFTSIWCNNSWSSCSLSGIYGPLDPVGQLRTDVKSRSVDSCSLLGASFIGLSLTIWQRMHSPSKMKFKSYSTRWQKLPDWNLSKFTWIFITTDQNCKNN